jgi:hypothetical protein
MSELPQFVIDRFNDIEKRLQIPRQDIEKEYNEIIADPFIAEDPQFKTDEERHRYAIAVLWTRYIGRPPVKEVEVIPLGYLPKRNTRSGIVMSSLFGIVKMSNKMELKRIVFMGQMADIPPNITKYCKYKVKLGQFSGGDLIADNRTKFENPTLIKGTPEQWYEKLGVKSIPIAKAKEFPSMIDSSGYVNPLDWRMVRGIISRRNQGVRKDGTPWTNYIVMDESVEGEGTVTKDGQVLSPGMTLWVDPNTIYKEEDECEFIGIIRLNKDGSAFMDVIDIIPLHVRKTQTS